MHEYDFFTPSKRVTRGITHVAPKFKICESKDLMIRGRDFYAIWDEQKKVWSKKQDTAIRIIDKAVKDYILERKTDDTAIIGDYMWDADSGVIDKWNKYVTKQMRDNYQPLDNKIIFSNQEAKREDFATHQLKYPLQEGSIVNYDELMTTLYSPDERKKLEWAIGAIVTGDSTWIQKFIVIVGDPGTGKSTFFKILRMLFPGYLATINAKALGDSHSSFALEPLKNDPLIAIEDDADLSRITDNTRLNSLVSHEPMTVNEKFKAQYENVFHAFIFLGTNKDVKITDSASGLTRRLIDVTPTGNKIPVDRYNEIMKQIPFELGAICYHCKKVYVNNKKKYNNYVPVRMLRATNLIYNFLEEYYEELILKNDGCRFHELWNAYNTYCDLSKVQYSHTRQEFKNELRPYFKEYFSTYEYEPGRNCQGYFKGFKYEKLGINLVEEEDEKEEIPDWLRMDTTNSNLDIFCSELPAQYANDKEIPTKKWENVTENLSQIDTTKLHYLKVPTNLIVIDFDIRNENGEKDKQANIEAAKQFPPTYAEWSKSGAGIHLHYIYDGDVSKLSSVFDNNIEVKVFTGNSSLRRKLIGCNTLDISTINSGLPLKGDKEMVNGNGLSCEKAIRTFIKRNLNKEYHNYTAPSVQFIYSKLNECYENEELRYDVSDLRQAVYLFACNSSNQSSKCIELVEQMKWKSKCFETDDVLPQSKIENKPIIFYDIEIFPNVFMLCWKYKGAKEKVKMINPSPSDIVELYSSFNLIGFNNRNYDCHMLWAAMMGYSVNQLYELSQHLISDDSLNYKFSEAYNMDYMDVYDISSKKQSLKKWEIELGITHIENAYPWDEPLDPSHWDEVAEYCCNDVDATEAVFNEITSDVITREMISELSGLALINTNRQHITKIIFGNDKNPNLVYTDLSTGISTYTDGTPADRGNDYISVFPSYEFNRFGFDKSIYSEPPTSCKSIYLGVDPSEGGYVYANCGMYENVVTFDVASMHPASIIALNKFGKYTKLYSDIRQARIYIKHGEFEKVMGMFDGKLDKYLTDDSFAEDLSTSLKLILNSTYGFCSAAFANAFKDPRDVDNIVAKRGALFMITLRKKVQELGYTVVHCKTDSIKVANPDDFISKFIFDFGKSYGYEFEVESRYRKICLVNGSTYIALKKGKDGNWHWEAKAAEFAHPYVFKTLFSKEAIAIEDMIEVKSVKAAMYLDMNEAYPELHEQEKQLEKLSKKLTNPEEDEDYISLKKEIERKHEYHFLGRIERFVPIKPGYGGGELLVKRGDKYAAVSGTKGYRWLTYNDGITKDMIDMTYFRKLVDDARATISKFGDVDTFIA